MYHRHKLLDLIYSFQNLNVVCLIKLGITFVNAFNDTRTHTSLFLRKNFRFNFTIFK
jgi:hypothetical protein